MWAASFLKKGAMKKVAIVEDDHTILEMYRLKFEVEGFTVCSAANGQEGLEVIERENPDVVLLDLMMPVMNGGEMLAQLRQTTWGKDVPVIVLTNLSKDEMPKGLNKLNVTDYIVKANTTPKAVQEKVAALLGV